jgi:hypothetical protein
VKRFVRFAALVFGLAAVLSAGAQIYQWKDKDGKTHFSDRPPPGIQVQTPRRAQPPVAPTDPPAVAPEAEANTAESAAGQKNAATGAPSPSPAPAQKKPEAGQRNGETGKQRPPVAEAREKAEKDAARNAQREQDCQRARAQYTMLTSGQRVSIPAEDGGRKMLEGEERAAAVARTQELMEMYCGKD